MYTARVRYILWDGVSTFARTRCCSKKYVLLVSNVFSFFFVQRWGRQGGVVVSIDIIIIINKYNIIIISIIGPSPPYGSLARLQLQRIGHL